VPAAYWRLATIDVDGTLTTVHGWAAIADALGRHEMFARTQRRFFAHEIGEDEHLVDLLDIATGATVARIEGILESTPRLDGIAEGVRVLHAAGTRSALLTHNPRFVAEWYCRKFGFDDFEGTDVPLAVDGVIAPPGAVRADKASGLEALARRTGCPLDRVVHVGDGGADAALFPRVGAGVALNSKLPEVERKADLVLRTRDFREVARAIVALPPRS
jgi:phosphoserine phosphatase